MNPSGGLHHGLSSTHTSRSRRPSLEQRPARCWPEGAPVLSPRQVQRKLGGVDADGNWQLGSPAPASATDDKTQTVAGYKRRAPTRDSCHRTLQCQQSAGSGSPQHRRGEKKKTVESKPVDPGEQPVPNTEEQPAAAEPNDGSNDGCLTIRTRGRGDGRCSHATPARPRPAQRERRGQRRGGRRVGQRLVAV